jgi:FixJ family two-component response regulator
MNDYRHTVLCVDDEVNILSSLKRLLRKEDYRLLTASSGEQGLDILKENTVNLVISDQRMPGMSGTEFLARVKEQYPEIIRAILSGYTEVDAIMDSINRGQVYKFLLKPWNDQNLILDIRQALEQYDLIQSNKLLNQKVLEQNQELKELNENLEKLIQERTEELRIQNHALKLARAVLQDLPMPIIGVSAGGMIVLINHEAESLSVNGKGIELGRNLDDYFAGKVQEDMLAVLESKAPRILEDYQLSDITYDINFTPLSARFEGKGVILTLKKVNIQ